LAYICSEGWRIFPGTQHHAAFEVHDAEDRLTIEFTSRDASTRVAVTASTTERLLEASVFESVQHVSDFFERGSLGYSDTPRGDHFDVLELRTTNWSVAPLAVDNVESTFFDDQALFPDGTAEVDNALLMRDIHHTWHRRPRLAK